MNVLENRNQIKRAILYDIALPHLTRQQIQTHLDETEELLTTYGGITLLKIIQRRHHVGSTSFIGRGKMMELVDLSQQIGANLIVINGSLRSKQLYKITEYIEDQQLKIEVWDRVDLIIHIFSKHARTASAKYQLELASIHHMGPRIYGMGIELTRQGGGIGARGLGETNIEIMKRHFNEHKRRVKDKLAKLTKTRRLNGKRRKQKGFKTVSLVGYTNAGKSALFRALTRKKAYVKDELFATLDSTVGQLFMPRNRLKVVLSDTIGFIRDLPLELIDAFKAVLEETMAADLLLHLVDISDPQAHKKIQVVDEIIRNLDIRDTPMLYVFNKIDISQMAYWPYLSGEPVAISATKEIHLDQLIKRIEDGLSATSKEREFFKLTA